MSGSGTLLDPYIIWNVNDLQNISLDLTAYYELGQGIDASGFAFTPLGIFSGALDGKSYVINQLTINISGVGTMRGALIDENQGTIQNLGIEHCQITVTGLNPWARAYAAGLFIENYGTISSCHVTGTITALATGSTSGFYAEAGGLGVWTEVTITTSYSTATVIVDGRNARGGAFVTGYGGSISECHATGDVIVTGTGQVRAAGFIAYTDLWTGVIINDCYGKGNASATGGTDNRAAGFVQDCQSPIRNCYSTGKPTGANGVGGFCQIISDPTGVITDCFWDTETSGMLTSAGGTGKTTAEMKGIAAFASAGWDIELTTEADPTSGYPFLSWQLGSSPIWLIFGETPRPLGYSLVQQELLELLRR